MKDKVRFLPFFIVAVCLAPLFATPTITEIKSPADNDGLEFNRRPWIVFSATDTTHWINDVNVQIDSDSGFSPATYDYWASDNDTNRDSFYPLPAKSTNTIRHRLNPGGTNLTLGPWWVRVRVSCDDTVDRDGDWSSAVLINISSVTWTDPTISAGSTLIRAVHFTQLRTAIDEVRNYRKFSNYAYTTVSIASGGLIRYLDLQEMRTALSGPYEAATGTAPSFTDDPVSAGDLMRQIHMDELRWKTTSYP
ncbi:MAG: hypothetical protein JW803_08800 [Endomicrobiales bacterium]|nr:hypothetical protein [Endomicrobiales bacterium]